MIHMLHKNRTIVYFVKKITFRGPVLFILIGRVLINEHHCTVKRFYKECLYIDKNSEIFDQLR